MVTGVDQIESVSRQWRVFEQSRKDLHVRVGGQCAACHRGERRTELNSGDSIATCSQRLRCLTHAGPISGNEASGASATPATRDPRRAHRGRTAEMPHIPRHPYRRSFSAHCSPWNLFQGWRLTHRRLGSRTRPIDDDGAAVQMGSASGILRGAVAPAACGGTVLAGSTASSSRRCSRRTGRRGRGGRPRGPAVVAGDSPGDLLDDPGRHVDD